TGAGTFVEDKLFATLDTKTRRWHLGGAGADGSPSGPIENAGSGGGGAHSALISDTVGFVRDLPHHLVASFKATLEEATHADMLLLVLDVSHPHAQLQLKTVVKTLIDIGCENIPTLLVLNKIDALKSDNADGSDQSENRVPSGRSKIENILNPDSLAFWKSVFPDALPASALEGQGIVQLTDVVRDQMLGRTLKATLLVPLADAKGITFIEKFSRVTARDYDTHENAVLLTAEVPQRILDQLPNNVPAAKVKKATPIKTATPWRIRTKPIKELLPEGFLEPLVGDDAPTDPSRTGITVGKKVLHRARK
ncbi:MAG TPA: GTPase, partial [Phycisphaerae bacterium]|nr:GTPase [Phycisphaerae bacterium]